MIQEGGALVKGCSKSDAIWASFMGSFAVLGGSSPPPPPIPTSMLYCASVEFDTRSQVDTCIYPVAL